ncbi:hypothetical protein LBMAG53_03250 [Planctomycetota bacterium]|nr:hypothetical protein LBMAG53_03250 [Planctomycetota bacterium]
MRHGFTLAELLVVVAIIGLLSGLLIPTISLAVRTAWRTACASNLRQVGMACVVYSGQWDGLLPAEGNCGITDPARSPAWFLRLPEMVDSNAKTKPKRSIFQCAAYRWNGPQIFTNASPKSYKMNSYLDDRGRSWYPSVTMPQAGRVVLFADAIAGETGMGQWGELKASGVDDSRHRGAVNVLHGDGHTLSVIASPNRRDGWKTALTWLPDGWPGAP